MFVRLRQIHTIINHSRGNSEEACSHLQHVHMYRRKDRRLRAGGGQTSPPGLVRFGQTLLRMPKMVLRFQNQKLSSTSPMLTGRLSSLILQILDYPPPPARLYLRLANWIVCLLVCKPSLMIRQLQTRGVISSFSTLLKYAKHALLDTSYHQLSNLGIVFKMWIILLFDWLKTIQNVTT